MKIVLIKGGLGNQIFLYGLYEYIKKNIDPHVYYIYSTLKSHNGYELERWFNVHPAKAPKFIYFLFRIILFFSYRKLFIKESFYFLQEEDEEKIGCYTFIDIYGHDKKYIKDLFLPYKSFTLNEKNKKVLNDICSSNSISIHVRRGDYLLPQFRDIYGDVCTVKYYKKAIAKCLDFVDTPKFFVFSDDAEWVKTNLKLDNAVYIDWNTGNDSGYDMYLMSHCKYNIIANSTFSFWGAYLNPNKPTVFYPSKWFNSTYKKPDIFPDHWVGLDS